MTFLGELLGYSECSNDVMGCNRYPQMNCVACGISASLHTPEMEAKCLRAIFGNRSDGPKGEKGGERNG